MLDGCDYECKNAQKFNMEIAWQQKQVTTIAPHYLPCTGRLDKTIANQYWR
jgi:hypothetical protein